MSSDTSRRVGKLQSGHGKFESFLGGFLIMAPRKTIYLTDEYGETYKVKTSTYKNAQYIRLAPFECIESERDFEEMLVKMGFKRSDNYKPESVFRKELV